VGRLFFAATHGDRSGSFQDAELRDHFGINATLKKSALPRHMDFPLANQSHK
jgi:hypothetical protein